MENVFAAAAPPGRVQVRPCWPQEKGHGQQQRRQTPARKHTVGRARLVAGRDQASLSPKLACSGLNVAWRLRSAGSRVRTTPARAPQELRVEPDMVLLLLLEPARCVDVALNSPGQAGQREGIRRGSCAVEVAPLASQWLSLGEDAATAACAQTSGTHAADVTSHSVGAIARR